MTSILEETAETVVAEMRRLGARFHVEGPPGDPTWVWEAKPTTMRNPIAAYYASVDKPIGLRQAMLAVILRQQAAEGAL